MNLPDTFSRRKRASRGESDPLEYGILPSKLRHQVVHVFNEAIARQTRESSDEFYTSLVKFLRKELGVARLARGYDHEDEFISWFRTEASIDELLDAVEAIFRLISAMAEASGYASQAEDLAEKVSELNARFLEASIGYQFENGQLLQIDSKFEHKHVVVPALHLLADPAFEAAEHEFLDAFDAFREGEYETTLVEACKSLESTIKVIGAQKGWGLDETWPLKKLVQAVFENELIPPFMQTEFTGLRTILESGVGTVRNKAGGHGAGEQKREVPRYIAAFQLHQTAAAILMLVEASKV